MVRRIIYTALDYEHPPILELDPPLTLQQGQSIISGATYNNTTNDYVNFGLLSTDEMMIIFGLVYLNKNIISKILKSKIRTTNGFQILY